MSTSNSSMICEDCHGTLDLVANTISQGRRPWIDEPKCSNCHGGRNAEQSEKLYEESQGHGGLFCSACHGSPHAIFPSREANDNLQNIRLQGLAGTLNQCNVCHSTVPTSGVPHQSVTTSISVNNNLIPGSFQLAQNYPNPFIPSTNISFDLPEESKVILKVFNILGQEVTTY